MRPCVFLGFQQQQTNLGHLKLCQTKYLASLLLTGMGISLTASCLSVNKSNSSWKKTSSSSEQVFVRNQFTGYLQSDQF